MFRYLPPSGMSVSSNRVVGSKVQTSNSQKARGPNALTLAEIFSFVHASPQTLRARSCANSRSA